MPPGFSIVISLSLPSLPLGILALTPVFRFNLSLRENCRPETASALLDSEQGAILREEPEEILCLFSAIRPLMLYG